jgi:histidinol dehydrogenase
VPQVDKIVGPGNAYVATAKRRVFGIVGIDMVAGPSEILVVSDGSGNPDWVAMDLFSQAEHDELAQSILICTDAASSSRCRRASKSCCRPCRAAVIETSLTNRGAFILVRDMDEAVAIANRVAPEHLELSLADPDPWVARSTTPAPSSSVTTPRSRSATTVPARTTCCRPPARRASRRRSASMTSRSGPA